MREMKDSGVEWLGEIPIAWSTQHVKNGFYRKNEKAQQDEPVILSLARSGVKERDISNNEGQLAESYYNYNPVDVDDLLINPMDLYSGANCSISKVTGVISPAYINLRYLPGYNPKYYDYYFKIQYWMMAFFAHGKGVSYENRWTLNAETLMNYPIIVPSEEEQKRIADYLDSKCSKIDSIIAKQEEIIEEIKRCKQSTISELVRHGIKNEKLKNTRCFWIGDIPETWNVGQLKYFASIRSGITLGKVYKSDEELMDMPYLRVANVQGEYVDLSDVATIKVNKSDAEKYQLNKGELLMTEGGDRDKLGRGSIWHGEIDPCLHQNHVFAVTTDNNRLNVRYLDYLTTSDIARTYFDFTAKKTTNLASTNLTAIMQFRIPIPPIEEQIEIADYLDEKVKEYNFVIKTKEKIIDKLQKYKKSLIYEVVTGKREV